MGLSVTLVMFLTVMRTNAVISGHPEGLTPRDPGAFVRAALTNTC